MSDRFARKAEEYEARAREYERRAAGGGPGSRGWMRGADGWHKGARKLREAAERHLVQVAREADRRSRHRARKDARRAERAERAARRRELHPPGWPAAVLLALLFTVGMVAVALATQVEVPGVLRLLSLFFASRALTAAANAVREAGEDAIEGMDRSRRWFVSRGNAPKAGASTTEDERIRVAEERPSAKVRVTAADAADSDDDFEEAAKADEAKR